MLRAVSRSFLFLAALAAAALPPADAAPRRAKSNARSDAKGDASRDTSPAATAARQLLAGREVEDLGPRIYYPAKVSLSQPLTEIERQYVRPAPSDKEIEIVEGVRKHFGFMEPFVPIQDPVIQDWTTNLIPAPEFSFEGLNNDDNQATVGSRPTPPDTNGDIGPAHYVQSVNLIFAVYN